MNIERPHILLVEDNPADVNLVQEALAEAELDCFLHVAGDGLQAIEFIEELDRHPAHTPDIVLLDLNLPKITGAEVLKRVRLSPRCGAAKILIISSSDAPADRERAFELGATGYFRKPSELEQFLSLGFKIRGMLEGESQVEPV